MMVDLDCRHQRVLIVGGGAMALRKVHQYLSAQAQVIVVAKKINEEFLTLPVTIIESDYDEAFLKDCFLVHAATDDASLNEQIVKDGRNKGIYCLSVTPSSSALHSVLSYEDEYLQCALSTKGAYPAFNRVFLQRLMEVYNEEYKDKLPYMKELRTYLISQIQEKEILHELLKTLPKQPYSFLSFLCDAIKMKQAKLLVFHGVRYPNTLTKDVFDFLQEVTLANNVPCYVAYLSQAVQTSLNEKNRLVVPFKEILTYLQLCKVDTLLYPMLLQEGRFYEQIKKTNETFEIAPLPFSTLSQVQELIQCIHRAYHKEQQTLLIVYHSSESGNFASLIKDIKVPKDTMFCCEKQLDKLDVASCFKQVCVYSLLMLSGYHMEIDGQRIIQRLKDHDVTLVQQSCISDPALKPLMLSKLTS